jgi:hypothetical protein
MLQFVSFLFLKQEDDELTRSHIKAFIKLFQIYINFKVMNVPKRPEIILYWLSQSGSCGVRNKLLFDEKTPCKSTGND